MPSYEDISPPDQTQHVTLTRLPLGINGDMVALSEPIELEFFVNRLNGQTMPLDMNGHGDNLDSDTDVTNYRNAGELCTMVASWDLEGPVRDLYTKDVLVPAGETIPLDPAVVRHMSLRFRGALTQELIKVAFPNQPTLPRSRRR